MIMFVFSNYVSLFEALQFTENYRKSTAVDSGVVRASDAWRRNVMARQDESDSLNQLVGTVHCCLAS